MFSFPLLLPVVWPFYCELQSKVEWESKPASAYFHLYQVGPFQGFISLCCFPAHPVVRNLLLAGELDSMNSRGPLWLLWFYDLMMLKYPRGISMTLTVPFLILSLKYPTDFFIFFLSSLIFFLLPNELQKDASEWTPRSLWEAQVTTAACHNQTFPLHHIASSTKAFLFNP